MLRPDSSPAPSTVGAHAQALVRSAARPARAACFWLAVALPVLHVPLFLHGLSTPGEVGAFVALLAANVAAMLLGRGYAPADHGAPSPAVADRPEARTDDAHPAD